MRERDAAVAASRNAAPDSYTDLNLYDRCITRGLPGAMIPGFYNHNYQIFQTPDYVVILVEMIHDARIIPLDGRAHLPEGVASGWATRRARWEGTRSWSRPPASAPGADERAVSGGCTSCWPRASSSTSSNASRAWTPTPSITGSPSTTPQTYAQPWTASIPMSRIDGPLFEYACHEGNYGLENILRGARNQERAADAGSR